MAMLFNRLYPGRRHVQFEGRSARREEHTEPVMQPDACQMSQMGQRQGGLPNDPSPPPSDSGGGDSNAHDNSLLPHREPHHSSISRVPRASFYNGSVGRSLVTADRSSERTDKIIQKEINDAIHAVKNRSEAINIGKMMKISLPEYIRGLP